ncbi:MAG TPA: YggS family pyridoxal phosphate-dependent enzyme [Candidatus Tenderia electrophaga]|uniref:Pyridoxal phosphate homeostasis protein n=1 Tax=Candidatus Tenderia electrophaga TaxID=1748243 RepID=A0A832N5H9_9GAMM|nr:YggS family pyridoxal phosphate-dependent enzyme [Candidatus Tenderia electrophaga]
MSNIKQRLDQVLDQIHQAEKKYQRPPGSVTLLAVSKTWPLEHILDAAAAGQTCFGENYVQESVAKIDSCTEQLEWHFIGHLQSNKSREIASRFDWVHSVDRLKLAKRLSQQRPDNLAPLNICLQVNISNEPNKSGFSASEIAMAAEQIKQLPRLKLRGLMAIPAPSQDIEQQRTAFHQVAMLQQQLIDQGMTPDTLSMGMSGDMEAAIAEGATIVRVGTAIFGQRHYPGRP